MNIPRKKSKYNVHH